MNAGLEVRCLFENPDNSPKKRSCMQNLTWKTLDAGYHAPCVSLSRISVICDTSRLHADNCRGPGESIYGNRVLRAHRARQRLAGNWNGPSDQLGDTDRLKK